MTLRVILFSLGFSLSMALAEGIPVSANRFCPLQTPEEWQLFLERFAGRPEWVRTCENGGCDPSAYSYVRDNVQSVLYTCRDFIAQNEGIERCTANYRKFVAAWMRQHDVASYGFTVDNHTYLSEQESADKPAGMMAVPPAIVAALPDRAKVEAAARASGLKYLTHDSALAGVRTFVLNSDPKGRFDQWLLLNLSDANSPVEATQPMSMLVVQKKDAAGKILPRGVRLHFRDYNIEPRSGKAGYDVRLHETSDGKCFSCHANGVRQLIARRTPVLDAKPVKGEAGAGTDGPADFGVHRLMEFNRRLRGYGAPDWDGKIAVSDFGPALGKAQGCTDCHDGRSRGVLTVAFAPIQLEQKIVHEFSMPYDTGLPRALERLQMHNPPLPPWEVDSVSRALEIHRGILHSIVDSRPALLRRWLLETRCRF